MKSLMRPPLSIRLGADSILRRNGLDLLRNCLRIIAGRSLKAHLKDILPLLDPLIVEALKINLCAFPLEAIDDLFFSSKVTVAILEDDVCFGAPPINPRLEDVVRELRIVSRKGMMKVLLAVYTEIKRQTQDQTVDIEIVRKETLEVLAFIYKIAKKKPDDDVPLGFDGKAVKFYVLLVSPERPVEANCRLLDKLARYRYQLIFVLAAGPINRKLAKRITLRFSAANADRFELFSMEDYKIETVEGSESKACCIMLKRSQVAG